MITFISFLITLFGCVNWLSIGMLQYDIVAGFFGTQANIFSRIIYIIIGFSAFWLMVSAIRQRGKVNIFKNKKEQAPIRSDNEMYNDRFSQQNNLNSNYNDRHNDKYRN